MGKAAQASFKSSSSSRHVNCALNASRCQSGETIVGAALTLAKTLPKTTRAIVANAWGKSRRLNRIREKTSPSGASLPPCRRPRVAES